MKVDAATPVTSEPGALLRLYDLDLDLQIDGSTVIVRDADVLQRRAREMGHPDEVCRRARRTRRRDGAAVAGGGRAV